MTVWIDMTTSYNWNRAAVGVVRVEIEVVREILTYHDVEEFHFFRYDSSLDEFIVLPESEVIQILDSIIYGHENARDIPERIPEKTASISVEHESILIAFKHLIKLVLIRIVYFLSFFVPHGYRPQFILTAKKIFSAMKRVAWMISGKKRIPIEEEEDEMPVKKDPLFIRGDSILSLGGVWNNIEINDRFHELRKQLSLDIYSISFDLIPIICPHLCLDFVSAAFKKVYYDISWYSTHVFCISENTMADFCQFQEETGVNNVHKSIITLGCDINEGKQPDPDTDNFIQKAGDFILYVSTIEIRKNHTLLYNVLCSWINEGLTKFPNFVFVGMYGWGVNDLKNLLKRDLRVKNKILVLDQVSDTGLARLYQNCLFTVYPSFYEGWGLPITESLAYGKFCIASNTSSMPEAGFGFTEHISPFDTQQWSERILYFYKNRDELIAREKDIQRNFTKPEWKKTAEDILHVVEKQGAGLGIPVSEPEPC